MPDRRPEPRHPAPPHPRLDREDGLRRRLREVSRAHPRYGYRRAWALLRQDGWEVNRKRIQRLWREEGLRVPLRRRMRRRLRQSSVSGALLRRARRPRVGARLSVRHHRRREDPEAAARHRSCLALAVEVSRRIDADQTVAVLEQIVARRGRAPELIRMVQQLAEALQGPRRTALLPGVAPRAELHAAAGPDTPGASGFSHPRYMAGSMVCPSGPGSGWATCP